jgi:hypothetical protein
MTDLTETFDMDVEELHLVGNAANGFWTLIAKAARDEVCAVQGESVWLERARKTTDRDLKFAYEMMAHEQ